LPLTGRGLEAFNGDGPYRVVERVGGVEQRRATPGEP
jgi:hypothetical protein